VPAQAGKRSEAADGGRSSTRDPLNPIRHKGGPKTGKMSESQRVLRSAAGFRGQRYGRMPDFLGVIW